MGQVNKDGAGFFKCKLCGVSGKPEGPKVNNELKEFLTEYLESNPIKIVCDVHKD